MPIDADHELSERARKTIIVALSLYRSELKRDPSLVEEVAGVLGYTRSELLSDYRTELVPLIGRLSRPDYLSKQGAH